MNYNNGFWRYCTQQTLRAVIGLPYAIIRYEPNGFVWTRLSFYTSFYPIDKYVEMRAVMQDEAWLIPYIYYYTETTLQQRYAAAKRDALSKLQKLWQQYMLDLREVLDEGH